MDGEDFSCMEFDAKLERKEHKCVTEMHVLMPEHYFTECIISPTFHSIENKSHTMKHMFSSFNVNIIQSY